MNSKIYIVIFQDLYNNLYLVGFYRNLRDSIKDINGYLIPYNSEINEIKENESTFGYNFDTYVIDKDGNDTGCMIRGFQLNISDLNRLIQQKF